MDRKPGGARPGAGRPKGSKDTKPKRSVRSTIAKAKAATAGTDELPHQFLARIAAGETIKQKRQIIVYYKSGPKKGEEKERRIEEFDYTPTYTERVDAAKAAAPYLAPRLATQLIKSDDETAGLVAQAFRQLAEGLPV